MIFKIPHYVMLAAPVGAFGAMAYIIGEYGISTLTSLGHGVPIAFSSTA